MRVCIRVFGIVQGVGFRPTVKRHADACDIAGSVSNKGPYVEIFAEGSEECVHSFITVSYTHLDVYKRQN